MFLYMLSTPETPSIGKEGATCRWDPVGALTRRKVSAVPRSREPVSSPTRGFNSRRSSRWSDPRRKRSGASPIDLVGEPGRGDLL